MFCKTTNKQIGLFVENNHLNYTKWHQSTKIWINDNDKKKLNHKNNSNSSSETGPMTKLFVINQMHNLTKYKEKKLLKSENKLKNVNHVFWCETKKNYCMHLQKFNIQNDSIWLMVELLSKTHIHYKLCQLHEFAF